MNSEKQKSYELQNIVSHSEAIIPPPNMEIWVQFDFACK